MSLDEMRGVDRETLFTTQDRRDGEQGHGGEEEEPIPPLCWLLRISVLKRSVKHSFIRTFSVPVLERIS